MQLELESLGEFAEAGADSEELLDLHVRGALGESLTGLMGVKGVSPHYSKRRLVIGNVRHVVHAVAVQAEAVILILSVDEELDVLSDAGRN